MGQWIYYPECSAHSAWNGRVTINTTDDAANNRTYVSVTIEDRKTDGYDSGLNSNSFACYITIDGSTSYGDDYRYVSKSGYTVRHTYSKYVSHNSNGAKTVSITACMYNYASSGFSLAGDDITATYNITLTTYNVGPYYSWKSLGQTSTTSNNESVTFNLAANQVGYYWYWPPGDGTITIYASSDQDTYGGFDRYENGKCDMTLSSTQTSGGSIVSNESYSDDDSNGNLDFKCTGIEVTGGGWAGQVFVHGYNNAASGTLYIDFTPSNYTITFNANGGSGAPSALSCSPGGTIAIPSTKPTRSGYIFLGWSISSTAYFCGENLWAGATYTPNASRTLYAVWGYTLTINPNGGWMLSGSTSEGSTQTTSSYTVGFTKTNSYGRWLGNFKNGRHRYNSTNNYGEPVRTGYSFNGWNVTSGNGSIGYNQPGANFYSFFDDDYYYSLAHSGADYGYYYYINNETTPTHSTITAQWTANTYTVTFDANGGGTPSSTTKTVTYNSTYGTLPTISRTNYTFNGWYTAASGGTKITSASKVSTSSNHTLYAQWTRTGFTVTFNKNGGNTPNPLSKSVTQGSTYGTLATCTRNGYTLKGWYTATSGGTKITSSTTVNLTADQTLYAQWTPITYTISYNANGGTGTTASSTHTYGTAKTLTTNGFTKFGHTFKGWAKTLDRAEAGTVDYNDKASVSNLTTTSGGTVNLYAVWETYTKVYIYTNKKDGTSKWVPVEKYTYTSG